MERTRTIWCRGCATRAAAYKISVIEVDQGLGGRVHPLGYVALRWVWLRLRVVDVSIGWWRWRVSVARVWRVW